MRNIIFALAALALATPAAAQDAARMDTVVRADADKGEFMGAVLVAKDGKVLFDKGYGSANLEWNIPNDGDTRFRLGSVTKQFTAAAILLLQERGKLKLGDPVKTWIPDAPPAWDKITIINLLTHMSGIPNFTDFPDYPQFKPLPATPASLIARVRDKPLDFAPGEGWKYSNSGFVVLTAIVGKASGQSYAAFVADNIFKPLGMADSGYDTRAIVPHRASGYQPGPSGIVNADPIDMTVPQGAGGLYSTTHDLLKWQLGLFGGKLLKPESLKAMLTPHRENYGFGIAIFVVDGQKAIVHSGGIDGFNSWAGYDPDRKLSVIVLANLAGGEATKLGRAMLSLGRGGTIVLPGERAAIPLPAATLAEYAGTYEVTPAFGFTVKPAEGKLIVQATNQPPLDLFAESPDHFFFKVVDAQIVFTRDASGRVTGAEMRQNGRSQPATRK